MKRKTRVIDQSLEQLEKEIHWHHELLVRRRWDDMRQSGARIDGMFSFIFNLMDELLLGEDTFYQAVQENLL